MNNWFGGEGKPSSSPKKKYTCFALNRQVTFDDLKEREEHENKPHY